MTRVDSSYYNMNTIYLFINYSICMINTSGIVTTTQRIRDIVNDDSCNKFI